MPADIIGTNVMQETSSGEKTLVFQPGPIFANIVLADEINRATPKTQSALLEAMEEHSVTVAGVKYVLEEPFFVLATQNPIEMEGTYPLPRAELDKFIFKLDVGFPGLADLDEIIVRTTYQEMPPVKAVATGKDVLKLRRLVREVPIAPHVEDYAARLVLATAPDSEFATDMVKQYVKAGSSPRGVQGLILSAKVQALLDGRFCASCDDVTVMALPTLRHRIQRNLEAEAEEITTDTIIKDILTKTPQTAAAV
jgi:MoxR-like ATPase